MFIYNERHLAFGAAKTFLGSFCSNFFLSFGEWLLTFSYFFLFPTTKQFAFQYKDKRHCMKDERWYGVVKSLNDGNNLTQLLSSCRKKIYYFVRELHNIIVVHRIHFMGFRISNHFSKLLAFCSNEQWTNNLSSNAIKL